MKSSNTMQKLVNGPRKKQKGIAVMEFALVAPALVVIMAGVVTVGMNLSRLIRVAQVTRDAASMYVRSVDFSLPGNKDLLVRLSQTLGITRTGGRGVIILSKITFIPQSKCTELNLSPCNGNKHVITQRLTIGNPVYVSQIASPSAYLLDSQGLVRDYMKEVSAVATPPDLTLSEGQYAYIVETYADRVASASSVYSRAVF
jgi:hypothetical protein